MGCQCLFWWPTQGPQGRARTRRPQCPLTLPSLYPDITGPIILQTYRAIADYEKSSGSEMALATGDVVDVVEKSQSGQPPRPAWTSLPWCLSPQLQAPTKAMPPRQPQASSPPGPPGGSGSFRGPDCSPHTVGHPLSESVPQGSSGDLHTFWAVTVHLWGLYPGGQVNFSPCV